MTINIKNN